MHYQQTKFIIILAAFLAAVIKPLEMKVQYWSAETSLDDQIGEDDSAQIADQFTTQKPAPGIAFSVARTSSLSSHYGRITYNRVLVNDGECFNTNTSEFLPSMDGFYWFHWSVTSDSYTSTCTDVRLVGGFMEPNIIRMLSTQSSSPGDTLSRDELVRITPGQRFSTESDCVSNIYSDASGQQTAFTGFHLDSVMTGSVVAFSVGSQVIIRDFGKIPFTTVNVDTHNGWMRTYYRAPVAGIYVISLSTATNPQQGNCKLRVGLYVNDKLVTGIDNVNNHNFCYGGETTISKTVLVQCDYGSAISAALDNYGPLYSDMRQHTALKGFLYQPRALPPVAWSVASSRILTLYSKNYPAPFDHVYVNQGDGWQPRKHEFITPANGTYCIHVSFESENFALYLNGVPIKRAYRAYSSQQHALVINSLSTIVRLEAGDKLHITNSRDSTNKKQTSSYRLNTFSGFRLYNTDT